MTESSDKKSIWLEAMKSQLPSELHCSLIMSELEPWFSHPFWVLPLSQAHPLEQGAASILDTIAMKREAFRDLLNRRKWEQALFVVERPYRADALAELIEERGVRSLLSAIRYVWSDTESVFSNWQTWEYIWAQAEKTKRGKRRENLIYVMDKPERAFFAALPDKFIVYRGFKKEGGEVGYSWTLDRSMGEWFARRYAYQGQPMLAKMEVNKSDVLAYFNGRKESEIVLHPIVVDFSAVTIKALLPARAEAA